MEFDLSAERAKRQREDKTLVMRDESGAIEAKYQLAAEIPADALDYGAEGKVGKALRAMFMDEAEADAFIRKYHPSSQDVLAIMRGVYGVQGQAGESTASGS